MPPFQKSAFLQAIHSGWRVTTLLLTLAYIGDIFKFSQLRKDMNWGQSQLLTFKHCSLQRFAFRIGQRRALKLPASRLLGYGPQKLRPVWGECWGEVTEGHMWVSNLWPLTWGAFQRRTSQAPDSVLRNFSLLPIAPHTMAISRNVHIPLMWIWNLKLNPFSFGLTVFLIPPLWLQKKCCTDSFLIISLRERSTELSWAIPWELIWR